jgi:hypothetical protein
VPFRPAAAGGQPHGSRTEYKKVKLCDLLLEKNIIKWLAVTRKNITE